MFDRLALTYWQKLMNAWGFSSNESQWQALLDAYAEAGRFYHTQAHLNACLLHLDGYSAEFATRHEVELALWFHDAVYQPMAANNEQLSADWVVRFLRDQQADADAVERVYRLIMATLHQAEPACFAEQLLVDIDLAILGASAAGYQAFETAVRQEYRQVPWQLYCEKRAELLEGFLERDCIYTSGCFGLQREQRARDNLKGAIAQLGGR